MKNLDKLRELELIEADYKAALEKGDAELLLKSQKELMESISTQIVQEAQAMTDEKMTMFLKDGKGGIRYLNKAELNFYNAVTVSGKVDPSATIPESIIERVFEDIQAEHPLLSKIDFKNTKGLTKFLVRTGDFSGAQFGKVDSEIKKELSATFKEIKVDMLKLSAFLVISEEMKNLAPAWIDKYIRTMLAESLAIELENGIINGNGCITEGSEQPIGMMADLKTGIQSTKYNLQDGETLTTLSPASLGKIMAKATKNKTINAANIAFIVNPEDYWNKIFPIMVTRNANGDYVRNFPLDIQIIDSCAVPKNKMIVGNVSKYFAGINFEAKVEESREYRFLEDQITYKTKMVTSLRPYNNDDFIVYNIENLAPQA